MRNFRPLQTRGFAYRQGFNAGWRNEPMKPGACPAYRNGWHIGRLRLVRIEMEVLGVQV